MEVFLQKYYQRLAAVHRLYSERKGDRYEYDSGYYCTGTGDRIWRICDQLSLFKKETGQSFVAYLTGYRMEKAARMLVETSEKSYMIAKSVGYTDPNYFTYVFKRQYGVSPSKYRTEYESN